MQIRDSEEQADYIGDMKKLDFEEEHFQSKTGIIIEEEQSQPKTGIMVEEKQVLSMVGEEKVPSNKDAIIEQHYSTASDSANISFPFGSPDVGLVD